MNQSYTILDQFEPGLQSEPFARERPHFDQKQITVKPRNNELHFNEGFQIPRQLPIGINAQKFPRRRTTGSVRFNEIFGKEKRIVYIGKLKHSELCIRTIANACAELSMHYRCFYPVKQLLMSQHHISLPLLWRAPFFDGDDDIAKIAKINLQRNSLRATAKRSRDNTIKSLDFAMFVRE